MRLFQTKDGIFVKRLFKVYIYLGDGLYEVPFLSAKRVAKLRAQLLKAEEQTDES